MATEGENKSEESQEEAGWQYRSGVGAVEAPADHAKDALDTDDPNSGVIEWTASEYVAHEKGFGWYIALLLVAVAVATVIYLLTRDVFSVVVASIMVTIFGVSSSHKPRVITYKVDGSGLTVGNKFYPYSEYRSFSVPQEGPFTTVALVPLKHLSLPVGAYLSPDSQDGVIEIVASHLPMEHREPGVVDHLMHHLRF